MHPLFTLAQVVSAAALLQSPDLSFTPAERGQFTFDTGTFKGRLTATDKQQGLTSLVDVKTGRELTKGRADIGLFTYYRFLSTDRRFGEMGWLMPKSAERAADGTVRIVWPPQPDTPFELTATYKWVRPDALDVETSLRPERDMPKFEIFLASYFADAFRCKVYLKPGRYAKGEPELAAADVSPLTRGLYYAFVRDLQAAQIVCDGRWVRGSNPVDWAITRYLAGALAVQEDRAGGVTCAVMARPEDCFSIYVSYNMDPPDGVADHHSAYLGLFGRDLKAGQTARTTTRLVVFSKPTTEQILSEYRAFAGKTAGQ